MNPLQIAIATLALSSVVSNPRPWLELAANSEQRQPVYLGLKPIELEQPQTTSDRVSLPATLRDLARDQIRALRPAIERAHERARGAAIELEAWPVRDDAGRLGWAFARWRIARRAEWSWLDSRRLSQVGRVEWDDDRRPALFLPEALRPWRKDEASLIFDDFLLFKDLYLKPAFGDCLWTDETGDVALAAWLLPELAQDRRQDLSRPAPQGERAVCRRLPQPARFDGSPFSLVASVSERGEVSWDSRVQWIRDGLPQAPAAPARRPVISSWPSDFLSSYRRDVEVLTGERPARFPLSGRETVFRKKSSAQPDHDLEALADYLTERYEKLGLRIHRQRFEWRGIPQSNLIAVIPGHSAAAGERPVLLADHYDTAFSEDAFSASWERRSAPGADDNVTAAAALLRAAEILPAARLASDVWLVHLTGEEFPADDLGARHLVSRLLADRQRIRGLVLMDMIGYRKPGDPVFQVSAGEVGESLALASHALSAARAHAPTLRGLIRSRFDARSYLYNTDGLIFSDAGFPVILLNEHLNYRENLSRPHYHQTTDTTATLDWEYASAIVRVALETAARLADPIR